MKHIVKIITLLVAITAFWIGLLETALVPRSYTWLLPVYFIVSLGCYGLLMVGVGLMRFPTCPQEAGLLQQWLLSGSDSCSRAGQPEMANKG
ncbi:PREDICTED: dolichol-phosphate mannosyltransferase subunit 3 isoform X1 [Nelumbo nucifera]|uniref:Dolichol-phosphate mannosyltransferase subunit 3 n=2 Tax=Nelumbo nucifera TaxID=4432 RepID=A0A1U8A7N5_NELNU|nr:PREDICTED: dolichol-phosphate mannosyltransferase subunit 3 isoform X1 [Nelumbo nucifera]XP_010263315.1 PREDICTED: dolichol-phosphate mannosyltransferase subunit 3 isoform X1 [Nelumbo nucifera]DAD46188.1 TPA_asm: hypothetical protein HUJ06_004418 [Nelumbo nucifera]